MNFTYRVVRRLIRAVAPLYFRPLILGRENFPSRGGVLLVANHASNLDPPLIAAYAPRVCHTMAKQELFAVPLLGALLRRIYGIPINRSRSDRAAIRRCRDVLAEGNVLLLFPEGTRSADGNLQAARAGAGMIAIDAQVPILPTYIGGTFESWPRARFFPRPHRVIIIYGEPFTVEQLGEFADKRDGYRAVGERIMHDIQTLKQKAQEVPHGS